MSELTMAMEAAKSLELKKPYDPTLFRHIADLAKVNYSALAKPGTALFRVALPKGKLFETYLDNLPAEHRQQMDCSCCRHFLKRFGALVAVSTEEGKAGTIQSVLWGDGEENEAHDSIFAASVKAMRELVEAAPIEHHFLSKLKVLGDPEKGGYEHFALDNNSVFEHGTKDAHEVVAEEYQHFKNLSEFVGKTKQEILDAVFGLFRNDARLKDQKNWVAQIEWLSNFKRTRETLAQKEKKAFTWFHVATQSHGRKSIYNGPMGTFIDNVLGGDSHEVAIRKFLEMTKGTNYMRPKAAPKEGAVQRAELIFDKLELATALERRFLTHAELRGKVWSHPAPEVNVDEKPALFGHLKTREEKREVKPALPEVNGGMLTLKRFMEEVLPETLELYFEFPNFYRQKYNLAGLLTNVHPDAKPILMWDSEEARNPVSGYIYQDGSTASEFGQTGREVRITDIVIDARHWPQEERVSDYSRAESLMFVFESGKDQRVQGTPMFPSTFRTELHEVRSVMESFFKNKQLTPLAEGQQPVTGAVAMINGHVLLTLKVVKKDAIVHYVVDRSH